MKFMLRSVGLLGQSICKNIPYFGMIRLVIKLGDYYASQNNFFTIVSRTTLI
jgi:hypothetical protein